jgi:hypothetical protein
MPHDTRLQTELEFEGKLDRSIHESTEELKKELEGTNKQANEGLAR